MNAANSAPKTYSQDEYSLLQKQHLARLLEEIAKVESLRTQLQTEKSNHTQTTNTLGEERTSHEDTKGENWNLQKELEANKKNEREAQKNERKAQKKLNTSLKTKYENRGDQIEKQIHHIKFFMGTTADAFIIPSLKNHVPNLSETYFNNQDFSIVCTTTSAALYHVYTNYPSNVRTPKHYAVEIGVDNFYKYIGMKATHYSLVAINNLYRHFQKQDLINTTEHKREIEMAQFVVANLLLYSLGSSTITAIHQQL